ncbi:hypothetical protein NTGM5_30001 [Candidatus Nitrotoga sp. M5]|nr:hypothetical protein NTGM5_30001 [Candidatus Nitrotoga sp. M5]
MSALFDIVNSETSSRHADSKEDKAHTNVLRPVGQLRKQQAAL